MSGLAYVILIAIMYFSKKNINTLENKIFSEMIIHTVVVLLVDIISRMYAIYYPITKFTEYLFKTNIFCFAIYIILYSYYVFALTSKKYVGLVEFDKNPNREYFKTTTLWLVIFIALNAFVIYLLPVTLIVNGE